MNWFDSSILSWLSGYTQLSQHLNLSMVVLSENDLFKGALFMSLFWMAWNTGAQDDEKRRNRQTMMVTLAGAFVALALGRILQISLPFRFRPMNDPNLHFLLPIGTTPKMDDMSSFPSDHAALFYSLATGGWLMSRRIGVLCYAYVTLFVGFPRVFLGLHYPTDVLAGGLMGIACTAAASHSLVRQRVTEPLLALSESYSGLFYGALFFVTFEVGTLFDSLRDLAKFIHKGHL